MCDSGVDETKVRVFKVSLKDTGSYYIVEDFENIADEVTSSDDGDIYEIQMATMTRDQLDKLPEFEGW